VAQAVHEEGRRAVHAAPDSADEVLAHARGVRALLEVGDEPLDVEAERLRVADQVARAQAVLVLEQEVVVLPEAALRARGLGGLGRLAGVRMDLREWEVPVGEPELVAGPG
jgi:hypothetical protein